LVPSPELLYAHVIKQREKGQVVSVTHKVVFDNAARTEGLLEASPV
jgi:hypothetical protein